MLRLRLLRHTLVTAPFVCQAGDREMAARPFYCVVARCCLNPSPLVPCRFHHMRNKLRCRASLESCLLMRRYEIYGRAWLMKSRKTGMHYQNYLTCQPRECWTAHDSTMSRRCPPQNGLDLVPGIGDAGDRLFLGTSSMDTTSPPDDEAPQSPKKLKKSN